MPALQVRDFPDELYEDLRTCALAEHRSIAQQTIVAVEGMLQQRAQAHVYDDGRALLRGVPFDSETAVRARIARRRAIYDEVVRDSRHLPKDMPSSADVVRECREERSDHLVSICESGSETTDDGGAR